MKFKNPFRGSKKGAEDAEASAIVAEEDASKKEQDVPASKRASQKEDVASKRPSKKAEPAKKADERASMRSSAKSPPKKDPPPATSKRASQKVPPAASKKATKKDEPTVVDLPENYVAFVLPGDADQEPSAKDVEIWRKGTVQYISKKLKAQYDSFSQLQLQILETQFGQGKPAPRFHLFLRIKADVHFNTSQQQDVAEVFEQYISSFQKDYLEKGLRPLQKCSLKYAKEVRARRLGSQEAGAVTAPKFYIAFIVKDPPKEPTQKQKDDLVELANKEFSQLLTNEFEDAFDKLTTLQVTGTELNAGKPEPDYNLYIEMEAVAAFTRDVPEPMDLFRPMAITSADFGKDIKATVIKDYSMLVVRCTYVETLPEPDEPPPPPDDDNEDGDPADGDDDSPEGGEGKGSVETVKMELGFYVALVLQDLEGIPSNPQVMDKMLTEFFTDSLAASFPNFVNIQIEGSPEYEAGIPLPRFNLLHPYTATLEFEHPPPEGDDVLKKILYCDLQSLYSKIKALPPPYNDMLEFTLGRALEQQVTDQAYGGELDDEQKRKEAARKAAEEKKRKEEEAARKAAEEKKRKEEEAARKAAEEKKRKEEEAAKKAAAEKKQKEETAKKAAEEKKKKEEAAKKAAEEKKKKEEAAKKAAADKKQKEEAAKKAAEEKQKKEEAAKKAAAEKKRKEEEVAKKAAADKKQKEEAAKKAAAEKKQKEDAAKKAAAEKKQKEEAAKKAAEEKKKKEEAAKKAAADKKKKEEAAKKAAAGKKQKEEAAKKPAADKKKQEATRRSSDISVDDGPTEIVGTADVFMALNIPQCPREPTKKDYDALRATTQKFYIKHLKKTFPTTFLKVEVAVAVAAFGENKPNDKYNVYLEWDINAIFKQSGDAPDRFKLCNSLITIDFNVYVKDHVWSLQGTPFTGARAVYTQQVNSWKK